MKWNFNKMLYAGFVLFGAYMIFYRHDYSEASMFFGIALAFDPLIKHSPGKSVRCGKKCGSWFTSL